MGGLQKNFYLPSDWNANFWFLSKKKSKTKKRKIFPLKVKSEEENWKFFKAQAKKRNQK